MKGSALTDSQHLVLASNPLELKPLPPLLGDRCPGRRDGLHLEQDVDVPDGASSTYATVKLLGRPGGVLPHGRGDLGQLGEILVDHHLTVARPQRLERERYAPS